MKLKIQYLYVLCKFVFTIKPIEMVTSGTISLPNCKETINCHNKGTPYQFFPHVYYAAVPFWPQIIMVDLLMSFHVISFGKSFSKAVSMQLASSDQYNYYDLIWYWFVTILLFPNYLITHLYNACYSLNTVIISNYNINFP